MATVNGTSGNDTLKGTDFNDVISGFAGDDFLYGFKGDDILKGGIGSDQLFGGNGNDVLYGGAGADRMTGGPGDDTFYVDDAGDKVFENTAGITGGTDLVNSSVSFTLPTNVENLTLTGSAAINGTGNSLANIITGNSAANILKGGGGDDTLFGGGGNDTLIGGAGADKMTGGAGNDTFYVDNSGDQVFENSATGGTDLVQSSVSFTLGDNVENLTLTGNAMIDGTGNALNNHITGNSGANLLQGGDGNDVINAGGGIDEIIGGNGADTLTGGGGSDDFFFQSVSESKPGSHDVITDFHSTLGDNPGVDDKLDLAPIDADSNTSGDQAFNYIGSAAFSGTAGELRADVTSGAQGTSYHFYGDVNGDGAADFELVVHLATGSTLYADDINF